MPCVGHVDSCPVLFLMNMVPSTFSATVCFLSRGRARAHLSGILQFEAWLAGSIKVTLSKSPSNLCVLQDNSQPQIVLLRSPQIDPLEGP